jgi:hypothetical protein
MTEVQLDSRTEAIHDGKPPVTDVVDLIKQTVDQALPSRCLADLSVLVPRALADIAGDVIQLVRDDQWAAMTDRGHNTDDVLFGGVSNHTGAPSISLDVRARELIERRLYGLGFREPMILGEECPMQLRSSLREEQVIFVIDALDGSTRANTLGEGFASVIVAFLSTRTGLAPLGGAIASSVDNTRFAFSDSILNVVRSRNSSFWAVRHVHDAPHGKPTLAMVTGGTIGRTRYLAAIAERASQLRPSEEPLLVEGNGGNPKLYPLLGLKLDALLEPSWTKPYDSALLLPLLNARGVVVRNAETGRKMTYEEVVGAFREFIMSGGDNSKRTMPPYLVAACPRSLGAAIRDAVKQIGLYQGS